MYCDATTQQLAKHKVRTGAQASVLLPTIAPRVAHRAACSDQRLQALSCWPRPSLANPAMQARYQQLEPVRVKGRQAPMDIFEVTSLHAEATGQRFALSPLGPQPLRPVPPAAEAAAAALGAGFMRRGSGALIGAEISLNGRGAAADAGLLAVPPTLAQTGAGDTADHNQQLQQQQGEAAGGPDSGALQADDRLLSVASTSSAAPIQLANHTPMIGEDHTLTINQASSPHHSNMPDQRPVCSSPVHVFLVHRCLLLPP